jgi:hypothetical protein
MFKRARVIVSLIVIFTLLLGSAAIVSAGQGPVKTPPPLRINGAGGQIPPGLLAAEPAENAKGYYVVQFVGPVEQAWKDAVTEKGAELLDYLPDFAFKARMNPGQARKVADLPNVAQVSLYHPVYKFAPDVTLGEMALYRVQIERGADWALARKAIIDTGIQVVGIEDAQVTIAATGEQLEAVARVLDVSLIENYRMFVKHNDGAGQIIGSVTANANGYDGSTQTVGIADTGIGGGTAATAHVDIPASRITAIYNWPGATNTCFSSITNDGSIDVDSGHGTHTSGSILSDGGPNGEGKGTAPAAHLVFQSIENYVTISTLCKLMYGYTNGYYLTGLPTDLKTLFQQAYNAGARIHSNSWGSASAGAYTTDSANADAFIWTNKDMVITFSAGNEGIDSNSDGVIDTGSLGAPASAKNVISVGASENARADGFPCDAGLTYTQCAAQGGVNNIMTYGGGWPTDYPANPIKDDPSGGNPEQMAAFSSRGPAADGRIKPDVVAPGTWVLSTYSDLYQQGYDSSANPKNSAWQYDGWGFPYNVYYKYMGGTSMSNPLLAGGAAVIRDYYQKANGINASAALVKATLVNTAVDLLDENNDGANDNDYPIPNNNEGWGRVNLAAATSGSVQYVEGAGLATNGTAYYTVTPTGGPLKITVAWSDYAAAANASVTLVNDLDLTVSGGAGNFLGNVFSGGWSATGGSVDRRNNLENVYIASPGAGDYTVGVKGYNVPNGPQPYALVVTGGTISIAATPTNTPTVPPTATFTPTPTNTPGPVTSTGYKSPAANSAVTKSAGDNNGYQTSPTSAYADDGIYAQDPSSGTGSGTTCGSTKRDKHIYYNYTFSLPTGAVPKGIEVRADAKVSPTTGTPNLCVELSWNGGTSWTTGKTTSVLTNTEVSYILGGSTNLWGRTWTASEFGTTTFRVRVTDLSSLTSNTFYLDYIAVNVTYQ